jgi:two-component system, OmpR family, response regulator ResD
METSNRKILIVDDDKRIRSLYKKLLALENYPVLEADSSHAATRLLMKEPDVALVLLDINMPVFDGSVLYNLLRRFDSSIKIIVTSAYPLEDQKTRIQEADDYYDKSQGTEVLVEKIRHTLKGVTNGSV